METVNKKVIIVSYLTQFFQYGIAIVVLPVILHYLDAKELGVWYVFLSVSSLVSLLDFGFSPSILRTAAYVASGAKNLAATGVVLTKETSINMPLLASLLKTSQNIYFRISSAIFVLGSVIGTLYLYKVIGAFFTLNNMLVWLLYILSVAVNFHYNYILSILRGLGYIYEYNINVIVSKLSYIVVLYSIIILGMGLVSLVMATFVNTIMMVLLAQKVLNMKIEGFNKLTKIYQCENLFGVLWKNARNSGIVAVGVFLLSQSGVFLSGLFLNLKEVASLGLCIQLFSILVVCSRVYLTTYTPLISSLWVKGDIVKIKKIFLRCQLIGYIIFILGFFIIITKGNWFLVNILHSNVLLPSTTVLAFYGVFYIMEITHGNCCSLIATSNQIPFTKSSLVAGMISISLTFILAKCGAGIISFPLALICGSVPYNSWKWPYEVYKRLSLKE